MRKLALFAALGAAALALGACDTMTQFGKDLKVATEKAVAGVVNDVSKAAGSASGTTPSQVVVPTNSDAAPTTN